MRRLQRTLKEPASFSGVGIHTGNQCTITFKPAPIDHGIVFVRTDLKGNPEVPADIDNVVELARGTTLSSNGVKVCTVEHILASLAGLEIDNAIIELDNNEPPVGDGSSLPFTEAILKAGVSEQDAVRKILEIDTPIYHSEPERGVDLVALPSDDFRITFMVDYRNPALGTQYTFLASLEEEFVAEFAPARTFCFLQEVEQLKDLGIIKGGKLDNALIICDGQPSPQQLRQLGEEFGIEEELFVGRSGILNDKPLRFPNELVRHKALDLLGDLALIGVPIRAHVLAARSGHAANVALTKKIKDFYQKKKIARKYQQREIKGGQYFLDIEAIMRFLPHRYPFLLVDRVVDMVVGKRVVAIKNVSVNEMFFLGHFPARPVMPGVLIVEAMAQTGAILLMHSYPEPQKKLPFFTGINKAKFKKPVVPGDQLWLEAEVLDHRRDFWRMKTRALVGSEMVAEAVLSSMVVEKESWE
jgi:UDP-3-O-[3-hydroxymyristoyl] N-acetylglucosamine deacetylase/3-hydroxyacyl-[acyl-carrier-protein] dehydratase